MTPTMLQLQFFNAKTREYEAASTVVDRAIADMRVLAEHARTTRTPWRIAKPERPLRPRYQTPRPASITPKETIQRRYVDWAINAGIPSITIYESDALRGGPFMRWTKYRRIITPEQHFAVEETTE